MNQAQQDYFSYCSFTNNKQLAELCPDNPNYFRTFFVQMDHIARKPRIRGLTPGVYGEVPSHIQVAHPKQLAKLKAGNYYSFM